MKAKWGGDMKFSSFLKGETKNLVTFVGGNSSFLGISIQFQEPPPPPDGKKLILPLFSEIGIL